MRFAPAPDKTDPPLIVDPNAVLPGPVSLERLETITRGNPKLLQPLGGVKVEQFAPGHTLYCAELEHGPIVEERLGVMGSKTIGSRSSL